MNKEELKAFIGKYIFIEFTLYSKKHKCTTYYHLYGRLLEVEDKNVLFKCNYNHEFIIPNIRISSLLLEGDRRTEDEYKIILEKELLAVKKKIEAAKAKQKELVDGLITINYDTNPNFI